jgi:putative glutamine amidotransferase
MLKMKKPLVGITTYYVYDVENAKYRHIGAPGQDVMMASTDYYNAINLAGGLPMPIMPIDDDDYIDSIVKTMDKFLFSGGSDVDPMLYGEALRYDCGYINEFRDRFEMKLLRRVIEAGKPILGICRGFQLINVFLGGSLYQDLKSQYESSIQHATRNVEKHKKTHKLLIEKESILEKIFDNSEILINSKHHQAVKTLGENLIIEAVSEDGLIEGFSSEKHSILAVQWHPEMMYEYHVEQLELFKWFINQ